MDRWRSQWATRRSGDFARAAFDHAGEAADSQWATRRSRDFTRAAFDHAGEADDRGSD
jgi:hypothetical protein